MKSFNKFSKLMLASGVAMGLSLDAHALAPISSTFVSGVANTWSDDFVEVFLDRDSSGDITVGDYFVGAAGITSWPTLPGVYANTNEMTMLFAIEVTNVGTAGNCGGPLGTTQCANMDFGPITAGFNAGWTALLAAIPGAPGTLPASFLGVGGAALDAATTLLVFEDTNQDYRRDTATSRLDFFERATDGMVRMTVGASSVGDFWYSPNVPIDPLAPIGALAAGTGYGSFSFNQTILQQGFAGWNFAPLMTATGSLARPVDNVLNNLQMVSGDATIVATPTATSVPEIDAVAGTGGLTVLAGALALAGERRRRRVQG